MHIKIMRTRDWQTPGEEKCALCGEPFYLGEVSPVAVSEDDTEIGEVCFACVHAGAEYIEGKLEDRARLSRAIADEDERVAGEGVTDLPTTDELLAAESFYGGDA